MRASDLIDRLADHKTLGTVPQEELAWLAGHGSLRRLGAFEVLSWDKARALGWILFGAWCAITTQ
jgi:hypothetical protein